MTVSMRWLNKQLKLIFIVFITNESKTPFAEIIDGVYISICTAFSHCDKLLSWLIIFLHHTMERSYSQQKNYPFWGGIESRSFWGKIITAFLLSLFNVLAKIWIESLSSACNTSYTNFYMDSFHFSIIFKPFWTM